MKMLEMLMFVCVSALMMSASVTADDTDIKDNQRAFLETIHSAYARYVVCYSCGPQYNKSKSQCDDDVANLAQEVCRHVVCTFTLDERMAVLRKFLKLEYQTEARNWCGANWVKKYI